jgi:hypothetical protein
MMQDRLTKAFIAGFRADLMKDPIITAAEWAKFRADKPQLAPDPSRVEHKPAVAKPRKTRVAKASGRTKRPFLIER